MRWWLRLRRSPAFSGYVLLLGGIVLNTLVQGSDFFSGSNISSILTVNTPLVLAAIAQTIVVLTGGIDLSIGSNMTLVNALAIVLANQYHWNLGFSWLAALAAATAVGMFNGLIVAYVRIPALLATFSSMSVVGGLALWILPKPGGSVPTQVYQAYGRTFAGIPLAGWIIVFVLVLWGILARRRLGLYFKAVGGRERSAYASGIKTERVKFYAYTLNGFITGIAGLSLTALTASGDPKIGLPFGLNSIAAVILGGAALAGGWGSISGSVAGAFFLGLIGNIVFFLFNNFVSQIPYLSGVSSFYQQLLSNLIVILGLASAVLTQREIRRRKPVKSGRGGSTND